MDKGIVVYASVVYDLKEKESGIGVQGYIFDHAVSKKGAGCTTDYLTDMGYFSKSLTSSSSSTEDDEDDVDEIAEAEANKEGADDALKKVKKEKESAPALAKLKIGIINYIEIARQHHDIADRFEAELRGMLFLLNKLKSLIDDEVKTVYIYSDCERVNRALNYIDIWPNQEYRHNGRTVTNKELVIEFFSLYNEFKALFNESDKTFSFKEYGSNITNQGIVFSEAFAGLAQISNRNAFDNLVSPDGYWKNQDEQHPLIKNTYVFHQTNQERDAGEIFMGGGIDPHRIGHKAADVNFSYIKLNEPSVLFERAFLHINNLTPRNDHILYFNVNELTKPKSVKLMLNSPEPFIRTQRHRLDFSLPPDSPVLFEMYPPGPAWRAFDNLKGLKKTHDEFITGTLPETFQSFDITEVFYELNAKGKNQLKPEYNSALKDIKVKIKYNGVDVNIPIRLGIDTPIRNCLKKIEKLEPKIILLTFELNPGYIRYLTFIQCTTATAIYAGPFSNLFLTRLVTPHEYS